MQILYVANMEDPLDVVIWKRLRVKFGEKGRGHGVGGLEGELGCRGGVQSLQRSGSLQPSQGTILINYVSFPFTLCLRVLKTEK